MVRNYILNVSEARSSLSSGIILKVEVEAVINLSRKKVDSKEDMKSGISENRLNWSTKNDDEVVEVRNSKVFRAFSLLHGRF